MTKIKTEHNVNRQRYVLQTLGRKTAHKVVKQINKFSAFSQNTVTTL